VTLRTFHIDCHPVEPSLFSRRSLLFDRESVPMVQPSLQPSRASRVRAGESRRVRFGVSETEAQFLRPTTLFLLSCSRRSGAAYHGYLRGLFSGGGIVCRYL
jgi:hypothetical protein